MRSLKDPTTHAAGGKRAYLRSWLQKGHIILLQETHWDDADHAAWEADLQGAKVIHTPAVDTGRGGTSGGVAIILPAGARVDASRVLLPGLALEVRASIQGGPSDFSPYTSRRADRPKRWLTSPNYPASPLRRAPPRSSPEAISTPSGRPLAGAKRTLCKDG